MFSPSVTHVIDYGQYAKDPSHYTPVVAPASPMGVRRDLAAIASDSDIISEVLNMLLDRSGLTQAEVARRLGTQPQTVHQYRSRERTNPSLKWFIRFAHVCGARIVVEFPYDTL